MESHAMGSAIGQVVFAAIVFLLVSLISPLFLQLSARMVVGCKPPFWRAWVATLFATVALFLVQGILFGQGTLSLEASLAAGFTTFVVQAVVYGMVLKDDRFAPIGCGQGCLVSIVQVFVGMVLMFGVVVVVMMAFTASNGRGKETLASPQSRWDSLSSFLRRRAQPPSHPASQSRQAAIQRYPELSVPDSPLNRRFLYLYEEAKAQNPSLLHREDWPMILVERAHLSLGGSPLAQPAR